MISLLMTSFLKYKQEYRIKWLQAAKARSQDGCLKFTACEETDRKKIIAEQLIEHKKILLLNYNIRVYDISFSPKLLNQGSKVAIDNGL